MPKNKSYNLLFSAYYRILSYFRPRFSLATNFVSFHFISSCNYPNLISCKLINSTELVMTLALFFSFNQKSQSDFKIQSKVSRWYFALRRAFFKKSLSYSSKLGAKYHDDTLLLGELFSKNRQAILQKSEQSIIVILCSFTNFF